MAARAVDRGVPGTAALGDPKWSGEFTFVQMADTQLGLAELFGTVNGVEGVVGWGVEREMMQLAVGHINRIQPAFAIVCGDLTNEFPTEELDKRAAQIADFKDICKKIDPSIPLLCVCGNHDVGNTPDRSTIQKYTEAFGDDYFSFWCRGVKCIVTNSQLWKDPSAAPDLAEQHARWFAHELETAKADGARHTLVFGHVPIFLAEAAERDSEYFNLPAALRLEILDRMAAAGASHYFCGHYHRNAGGIYKAAGGRTVEVVVTAAAGVNIVDRPGSALVRDGGYGDGVVGPTLSGLRVVHVGADGLRHKWHTFADLNRHSQPSPLPQRSRLGSHGRAPPSPARTRSGSTGSRGSPSMQRPRAGSAGRGSPAAARRARHARSASSATTVRRLRLGEWERLRDVRLEALKESPESFQTTFESAKERTQAQWQVQASEAAEGDLRCTFVAVDERGATVGIASLYRDMPGADGTRDTNLARAELVHFWVDPVYRGFQNGRVATRLLDGVVGWGRDHGVVLVTLGVKPGNRRASSFYHRCGFILVDSTGPNEPCCCEQRMALSLDGRAVKDILAAAATGEIGGSGAKSGSGSGSASGSGGAAVPDWVQPLFVAVSVAAMAAMLLLGRRR